MGKKYRYYDPKQILLFPPNIREWLPEGHLVFFIDTLIDTADISAITDYYEQSDRGNPPYDPRMMTKILCYAYCIGEPSSRKINKALYEDVAFRVLAAGNFPDFRTISDFRKIHLKSLEGLFVHVLDLCSEAGLVKLGTVAIDGTKVKANASIDKNYNHQKLTEKEEHLQQITHALFEKAEHTDDEEDRIYGKDHRGDELPDGFRTKQEQLERIRKAKTILEQRQQEKKNKYDQKKQKRTETEKKRGKRLRGRKLKKVEQNPEKSAMANTTDPESRIMKTRNGYAQAYNGQLAVDTSSQVIVAADLVQDQNDKQQLQPMTQKIQENTGRLPPRVTTDAGYDNEEQITPLWDKIDLYIPTQKDWKTRKTMKETPPPRGRIPKELPLRERMKRKLLTKKGKAIYKKRGSSVEPVNGQIKDNRGFDRLSLRGLAKGKSEWKFICTTHNILKLWRHTNTNTIVLTP
jgi:transposase